MKKITVNFTGFVLDKEKSYHNHGVYSKDGKYILVLFNEEEYCEVKNIHFEDDEILEDGDICTFDFFGDLVNFDGTLKDGPLEVIKY